MTNKEKALNAFMEAIGESRELLTEIQAHLDDHMGTNPEDINWGHVGSALKVQSDLKEIANFLFGREE